MSRRIQIFENLESFIFIKKKFNEWIKMRSKKIRKTFFGH